jgi:hypothetical protein
LEVSFPMQSVSYQRRVCGSVYPSNIAGNGSVNMFPQQWRIFGSVVFYAVHVISKESRQLALPRTSCLKFHFRDCTLSLSSSKKPTLLGPLKRASPYLWTMCRKLIIVLISINKNIHILFSQDRQSSGQSSNQASLKNKSEVLPNMLNKKVR